MGKILKTEYLKSQKLDKHISGIIGSFQWSNSQLTFNIPSRDNSGHDYFKATKLYFESWRIQSTLKYLDSSEQNYIAAVQQSISAYGKYLNLKFTESKQNVISDINVLGAKMFPDSGRTSAFRPAEKDNSEFIWLEVDNAALNSKGEIGGGHIKGYLTLHEIGHALGLVHTDDWASTKAVSSDDVLDNSRYTVMSYEYGGENQKVARPDGVTSYGHSVTPMALDIAALQAMYGKSPKSNHGNTTYHLTDPRSHKLDVDGKDGNVYIGRAFYCIYDTGGTNSIEYSGTREALINLNDATLDKTDPQADINILADLKKVLAGNFSKLNAEIQNDLSKSAYHFGGYFSRLSDDLQSSGIDPDLGGFSIAHGTKIQNAKGGSGNDIIIGNEFDNSLAGGSGDDVLIGGAGHDTLSGGGGNDILYGGANPPSTSSTKSASAATAQPDTLNGGDGNDTFYISSGSEKILGGAGSDTFLFVASDANKGDSFDGGSATDTFTIKTKADFRNSALKSIEQIVFDGTDVSAAFRSSLFDTPVYFSHTLLHANIAVDLTIQMDQKNLDFAKNFNHGGLFESWGFAKDPKNYAMDLSIHIIGTSENNKITGTEFKDKIDGGKGNDVIYGSDGTASTTAADTLLGGEGNDTLIASGDNSYLDGGTGADKMIAKDHYYLTFVVDNSKDEVVSGSYYYAATSTVKLEIARSVDFGEGIGRYKFMETFKDWMTIYMKSQRYGAVTVIEMTKGDDKLRIGSMCGDSEIVLKGGKDTIAFKPVAYEHALWDSGPDARYELKGFGSDDSVDLSAYALKSILKGTNDVYKFLDKGKYLFAPGASVNVHQVIDHGDYLEDFVYETFRNDTQTWQIIEFSGSQEYTEDYKDHVLLQIGGASFNAADFLI